MDNEIAERADEVRCLRTDGSRYPTLREEPRNNIRPDKVENDVALCTTWPSYDTSGLTPATTTLIMIESPSRTTFVMEDFRAHRKPYFVPAKREVVQFLAPAENFSMLAPADM